MMNSTMIVMVALISHRDPIDWIFTKGLMASDGEVKRTHDASDHYPVVATLNVVQ